ncbi:MAG: DNA repair protein [Gammaproteobacteria bacterium]|nr:DNA repair protein [Gammaproteobacteria bacterium]
MTNEVVIKKGLKLGYLDAEADLELLETCWIDNGQLNDILDLNSPTSVVLGRTGAGKSALLYKVSLEEKAEILDPNNISIRFLEHSNIIQFFTEIGVKLDLFYRILWRHILVVELLKLRYNLKNEGDNRNLLDRFRQWVGRDSLRKKALDYFTEWGDKFWLETDEQLQELTNKFTCEVKNKLGTKFHDVDVSLEGARNLSEERKAEIKSLATQVVSQIQIQRLTEVLNLLSQYAFCDKQKRFYILIDKLDEDWAETETRCRFIRALIEETKSMRNIPQVKIITALRRDLLDLIFDKTRDSGFQQEKYEAYMVQLMWGRNELRELLERRIQEVYKKQYTSDAVRLADVFPNPKKGDEVDPIDYILDRTLLRPRDAIQFANECFTAAAAAAADTSRIPWTAINTAEANYSMKRLKSLNEEWSEYYPALELTVEVLRGICTPFTRSTLSSNKIQDISVELHDADIKDPVVKVSRSQYEANAKNNESDLINSILMCLYHVGVIGIKISTLSTFVWSHTDQPRISKSESKRANQIKVHEMYQHALEVFDKDRYSI